MFSSLPFAYMFFVIMGLGSLFSISSLHWFGIWVGLEINLIGFLPVLIYEKSMSETESAVKYFVVQAMGSSLLMFGSLSLYHLSFTWESVSLDGIWSSLWFMVISAGLFMKLGLFPFHFWLPSVMAGLPWFSCLLLATWQKLAPLFLIASLVDCGMIIVMVTIFCLCCVGSSVVGGLGGLNQTQMRGLIAYSSIGHLGWMTFGMLHGEWVMKVYFFVYVFITFCMFVSFWFYDSECMKEMNTLTNSRVMKWNLSLVLLSLGGLPPLLGFIPKLIVIAKGISGPTGNFVFFLILGSLISLSYYLGLVFSLVLDEKKMNKFFITKQLSDTNIFLNFLLIMNLFGGLLIIMVNFLGSL
uniref:NADH-ubiquinone oxidoreductase chain 2 n=1 Tax=Volva habei TaxID=3079875 RepID=A0AA96UXB4_9CAEN|nr:NADH dehydrogenase subunit 2 [Volva habei]WNX95641.1 NADH dehydrogenase subunit 2 [Volva habei]